MLVWGALGVLRRNLSGGGRVRNDWFGIQHSFGGTSPVTAVFDI